MLGDRNLRVDLGERLLASHRMHQVGDGGDGLPLHAFARAAADVWRDDAVGQPEQRVIGWRWLGVEHVGAVAGDSAALQCCGHVGRVDDGLGHGDVAWSQGQGVTDLGEARDALPGADLAL